MTRTLEDLKAEFRAELLGLMAECWAMRHVPPSDFGRLLDGQFIKIQQFLARVHLFYAQAAIPNGQPKATQGAKP